MKQGKNTGKSPVFMESQKSIKFGKCSPNGEIPTQSKYEVHYKGNYMGRGYPSSIRHQNFEIRKDNTVLLTAQKHSRSSKKKNMTLSVHPSVGQEELPVLLGIFLL
jgi:hypothetical protein